MCTGKCPGFCCQCFILPFSIKQMHKLVVKYLNENKLDLARETAQISNMLICLGANPKKIPNIPKLKPAYEPQGKLGGKRHWNRRKYLPKGFYYTCKNYNITTHLCMIYKTRPELCRKYPENNRSEICMFNGCDYDNRTEEQKNRFNILRAVSVQHEDDAAKTKAKEEDDLLCEI